VRNGALAIGRSPNEEAHVAFVVNMYISSFENVVWTR